MIKTLLVLIVASMAAGAQPVGAGFKVGAPITDAFKLSNNPTFAQFSADSPHYTFGPYVELRLPFRMSVEADALYRKYNFSNAGISSNTSSWEFPVVLKHKILAGPIKPYFEGGVAFSRLSEIKSFSVNHLSNYGVVVGGGVEVNLLLLKISPEIRYTGWALRNFDSLVQSNRNQVALLVGFGF